MSYLKDREIWLSNVPTGNPPVGYFWKFIQNGKVVVRDSSGNNQMMVATSGSQAITGSLTVTGGITGTVSSASYVEYSNVANKPTLISGSAQITALGFATTGSNTFQANQVITGSLFISQNLVVAGSSSIQYISSSVLDIADNIITVNAFNPGVRFGGLAVIDSGSSPQVSGSILFDSIKDQWIFVHQNQSVVTSSVVLMGPETYNDLGNESYISANRLPKGSGIEHLRDSNITDTGTVVSINSNTQVTGSFTVVSGSAVELQVTNTGVNIGNALTDNHNITGSLRVTGSMNVFGSVGIGVTSPAAELQVGKSSDVTIAMSNSSSVTSGARGSIAWYNSSVSTVANIRAVAVTDNVGTQLEFYTRPAAGSLTQRLTLDSAGNLGLGVTPSAWFSDRRAFQIQSGGSINGSISTPSFVELGANFFHGSLGDTYISTTQATKYRQLSGAHEWYNSPSGTAGNAISFTQAMTLDANGRLGIGTTSPQSFTRLEVAGTAGAQTDAAQQVIITAPTTTVAHGAGLRFNAASGAKEAVGIVGVVNEASGNLGAMTFHTYGGGGNIPERMRITSGGNVGIGTTDLTSTRLRIKSTTTGNSNFVLYTEDSSANILFWVRDDGYINTGSRTSSPYNLTSGNAANMVVGADGTLYRSTSSLKYKKDVRDYDKGLDLINLLRPVYYKGKSESDGDKQFAGLIAEEVHDLGLTEFVQYAPDGSPDALSYQNMIALAVKAIQEQQTLIESLKSRIEILEQ